jgi:hypothetical protein
MKIEIVAALISGPIAALLAVGATWALKPIEPFPTKDLSFKTCLAEGDRRKKDYIIEFATLIARTTDASGIRHAAVRTTYAIRALRDITPAQKVFVEKYDVNASGGMVKRWHGPQAEEDNTDGSYAVPFQANRGDVRLIVTGADFQYRIPPTRTIRGQALSGQEDFWEYPNNEDVICNLALVVEKDGVVVTPVGKRAELVRGDTFDGNSATVFNVGSIFGAQWTQIVPGDTAIVFFK